MRLNPLRLQLPSHHRCLRHSYLHFQRFTLMMDFGAKSMGRKYGYLLYRWSRQHVLSSHSFLPLPIRLLHQQLPPLHHNHNSLHRHRQAAPTNRMLRRSTANGWCPLVASQPPRSLRSQNGRTVIWPNNNGKNKNGVNVGAKKSSRRRKPSWTNIILIPQMARIPLRVMYLITALRPRRSHLRPHQLGPPNLHRLSSHLIPARGPPIVCSKDHN